MAPQSPDPGGSSYTSRKSSNPNNGGPLCQKSFEKSPAPQGSWYWGSHLLLPSLGVTQSMDHSTLSITPTPYDPASSRLPSLPSLHELSGDELESPGGPGLAPRSSNAHVAMGTGFDLHSPSPMCPFSVVTSGAACYQRATWWHRPVLMINDLLGPQGSQRGGRHGGSEAAWEEGENQVYEMVRRHHSGGSPEGVSP